MNSMFPVWTLSSLILSYTLGSPISKTSSTETYMENNVTVSLEHNKTRLMENNATKTNFTELIRTRYELQQENKHIKFIHLDCHLATSSLSNLGSSLQIGDEIAGDLTRNPMGIGNK